MRKPIVALSVVLLPLLLAGCGSQAGGVSVNLSAVLDRTAETLEKFHAYLKRYDYTELDDAMFKQLNNTIEEDLNRKPRIHPTLIATKMRKDVSIVAHGDINGNGKIDAQEPKLFTIEFDPENDRIILTSTSGNSTGRVTGPRGFFAGVFIGSMVNRQRSAGIKPGHFNKRNVADAPIKKQVASRAGKPPARARSRARSGGVRAGK